MKNKSFLLNAWKSLVEEFYTALTPYKSIHMKEEQITPEGANDSAYKLNHDMKSEEISSDFSLSAALAANSSHGFDTMQTA